MNHALNDNARTAFVIEDDVLQISWIRMTIGQNGTRVIPVDIDRNAIIRASLESSEADVFFIDIFLNSDLDGVSTTKILADTKFPGSIIFISGSRTEYLSMAQRLAEAWGLKVKAAIEKPLLPSTLTACLK